MSKYGWLVLVDYTTSSASKPVKVYGPSNLDPDIKAKLDADQGVRFRMYDDDGNLYYAGKFVGDENSEDAFGPLDDYGMPNAGATTIKYQNENGAWEVL